MKASKNLMAALDRSWNKRKKACKQPIEAKPAKPTEGTKAMISKYGGISWRGPREMAHDLKRAFYFKYAGQWNHLPRPQSLKDGTIQMSDLVYCVEPDGRLFVIKSRYPLGVKRFLTKAELNKALPAPLP